MWYKKIRIWYFKKVANETIVSMNTFILQILYLVFPLIFNLFMAILYKFFKIQISLLTFMSAFSFKTKILVTEKGQGHKICNLRFFLQMNQSGPLSTAGYNFSIFLRLSRILQKCCGCPFKYCNDGIQY